MPCTLPVYPWIRQEAGGAGATMGASHHLSSAKTWRLQGSRPIVQYLPPNTHIRLDPGSKSPEAEATQGWGPISGRYGEAMTNRR